MKRLKKQGLDDYILYIVSLSLASLTAFSALMLFSTTPSAHADASSATATVSVSEVCSLTSTVNTPHTADMHNGLYSGTDYSNGIGQTTLKAFCNDGMGFAIYAIGYTNNEFGNTKLHWSGASNSSDTTHDISTGIYNSGSTTNSTWSMKLASVAGTYVPTIMDGTNDTEDFTNWHEIPEEYTKVAYKLTGTDTLVNNTGAGSSITVTYDSYISTTQPAGTYTGQVKYTLVHPSTEGAPTYPGAPLSPSDCPANNVCYAPNASDIIGTMISANTAEPTLITISDKYPTAARQTYTVDGWGSTVEITNNSSVTLIAPNYKREGYGFAGWSTEYDAKAAFDSGKTVIVYGPNQTISTNPSSGGIDVSHGLILYPVWLASSGTLQDFSCVDSNLIPASYNNNAISATLSSVTALTDTRDGNVYAIAKLADNKCWMIENLRLNNEYTTGVENIAKAQGYGDATASTNNGVSASSNNLGKFIGLAASENADFGFSNTTANSLYSVDGSNGTINIYNDYYPAHRLPRYNNDNTNSTVVDATNLVDNYKADYSNYSRWYGYGNYYNWPAAIADTNYYDQDNVSVANTSICPFGWHLPLGVKSTGTLANGSTDSANNVGSFSYLDRKMGGTGISQSGNGNVNARAQSGKWRSFPNNFVYSGYWGGTPNHRIDCGLSGSYWSSSAHSGYDAHYFALRLFLVNPISYASKSSGHSVRCLADS